MSQAFIVRTENAKGEHQGHHIFSSNEKAKAFIDANPVGQGLQYRVIVREAAEQAVKNLVKAKR
jgi:hypothetical protein